MTAASLRTTSTATPSAPNACARFQTNESLLSSRRIKPEGADSIVSAHPMNILIVGLGEVGSYLAKVLSTEGHSITVVDPDLQRMRRVADLLDVQAVHGDGSRPDVLDRADAHQADLLLAVSNDDKVNMLTCLFGKRMGAKKTVLRLRDTSAVRRSKTFFRKNLLYDLLLSLDDLAAEEIVKTVRQKHSIGVDNFAEGKVQLRRFVLQEGGPYTGSWSRT